MNKRVQATFGFLAVGVLDILGRLPLGIAYAAGNALLPPYVPFRLRTRSKLRNLRPAVDPFVYYRLRLRLALLSVRSTSARQGNANIKIEEGDFFAGALSSGKPVLLLGWHQGPVELLHEIPARSASGRPFFVMTASAFAPALAEWMARKRQRGGVRVVRPGEANALRDWARDGGVLAIMVDQVPGEPEEWLALFGGTVKLPWPGRLIAWVSGKNPEVLAVSTRLEKDGIVFRYDTIPSRSVKETMKNLMEEALSRAPEQYNWSYPKARA
jgi:lauroyl/myristoyl acyltransferase